MSGRQDGDEDAAPAPFRSTGFGKIWTEPGLCRSQQSSSDACASDGGPHPSAVDDRTRPPQRPAKRRLTPHRALAEARTLASESTGAPPLVSASVSPDKREWSGTGLPLLKIAVDLRRPHARRSGRVRCWGVISEAIEEPKRLVGVLTQQMRVTVSSSSVALLVGFRWTQVCAR